MQPEESSEWPELESEWFSPSDPRHRADPELDDPWFDKGRPLVLDQPPDLLQRSSKNDTPRSAGNVGAGNVLSASRR